MEMSIARYCSRSYVRNEVEATLGTKWVCVGRVWDRLVAPGQGNYRCRVTMHHATSGVYALSCVEAVRHCVAELEPRPSLAICCPRLAAGTLEWSLTAAALAPGRSYVGKALRCAGIHTNQNVSGSKAYPYLG